MLASVLQADGYQVEDVASAEQAMQKAARRQFQLVLLDWGLPMDGRAALRALHVQFPQIPVLVIAPGADLQAAMKLGTAGYLRKPLATLDEARLEVRRVLDHRRRADEAALLREEMDACCGGGQFHTRDRQTFELLETAREAAESDGPILLVGERGSGRETLARFVHSHSRRAARVFVSIDCGASAGSIGPRLFGRESGQINEDSRGEAGCLERAYGGTALLRELTHLDNGSQKQLQRLLQVGAFERIGGRQAVPVDVRLVGCVVPASETVAKEIFGAGRLAFTLSVPPLRERPADIPLLADSYLARFALSLGRPKPELSQEALHALIAYRWPGNAREMRNVMERAALLARQVVAVPDLGLPSPQPAMPLRLDQIERQAIEAALINNQNNRTRAAAQLGISLRTLQYRLKEYGLSNPRN
jgi:DNA-binding NtrC family response regulator